VHEELRTTPEALRARFAGETSCTVVLEAGSPSAWIAWMLSDLGHRPMVVHPRRLKLITASAHKTDRTDAEWLLRLAEADPGLLCPVRVRSRRQQADLALLRTRKLLMQMRSMRACAPDSDLKRFGARLMARGGRNAKKRAVVAVARQLAVLLVALWKSGEVYQPLRRAELQAVA
jgi:transposase